MRRAPVIAFTAGLTVFGGLLLAGTTQPQPRVPLHAIPATQVSFFAAVVAFEVAVVAGVCAAARALALWRIPTARGADRTYVCRGATISTSALGVAAAGWAVTLGLALNRLPDPNWVSSAVGGFIMIGAAVVAITATQHLRANPFDDADEPSDPRGLFGLTERATGLVQRHPILSCSTVAALSVWPAMAHAETTFIGALPWGLTQAAAVVLAYLVLGPALGLRRPQTA